VNAPANGTFLVTDMPNAYNSVVSGKAKKTEKDMLKWKKNWKISKK